VTSPKHQPSRAGVSMIQLSFGCFLAAASSSSSALAWFADFAFLGTPPSAFARILPGSPTSIVPAPSRLLHAAAGNAAAIRPPISQRLTAARLHRNLTVSCSLFKWNLLRSTHMREHSLTSVTQRLDKLRRIERSHSLLESGERI